MGKFGRPILLVYSWIEVPFILTILAFERLHDNIYRTWENFGVGKNCQIECLLPIFTQSVVAIHVAHSAIFYPPISSD